MGKSQERGRMKQSHWTTLLFLVIGGLAGWFGRGLVDSRHGTAKAPKFGETTRTSAHKSGNGVELGSHGGQRFSEVPGNSDPEGRASATLQRFLGMMENHSGIIGSYERDLALYDAIRQLSTGELRQVLAELERLDPLPRTGGRLQELLVGCWAKQDGEAAADYAKTVSPSGLRDLALGSALLEWAENDPEAALQWCLDNPESMKGHQGQFTKGAMLARLARDDMKQAFSYLKSFNIGPKRSAIALMAAEATANAARRGEFLAELNTLDDSAMFGQGITSLVNQWSLDDPRGAIEFVESEQCPKHFRKELRKTVIEAWSFHDPEPALDWYLETESDSRSRNQVVIDQFVRWMGRDPAAAADWLAGAPKELRTDTLFARSADTLSSLENYAEAVRWAEQIQNDAERNKMLKRIYSPWKFNMEEEARQWLETLDAPTRTAVEGSK